MAGTPDLTPEDIRKAAQFFDILAQARAHGKDWWANFEIERIGKSIEQDEKIAALAHALEMVRDADDYCKADGGKPLPIPQIARRAIDAALACESPFAKRAAAIKARFEN